MPTSSGVSNPWPSKSNHMTPPREAKAAGQQLAEDLPARGDGLHEQLAPLRHDVHQFPPYARFEGGEDDVRHGGTCPVTATLAAASADTQQRRIPEHRLVHDRVAAIVAPTIFIAT